MVVWRQLLVASALVCGSAAVNALRIDNCPEGTFPVSVLDDPVIHCLSGEPCSGTYSSKGLPQGVGACPANTGCALLPHNPSIMGCVAAGRGDVTYVNADGTLTKDGKIVSAPDSSPDETTTLTTSNNNNNNNSGNSKGDSDSSTTSTSSAPVTPGTVAAGNLDDDEKESGTPTTASGSKNSEPSTTPATSSKAGSSTDSSRGNLKGSSSNSSSSDSTDTVSTPTPSPTPKQSIEQVNAQQPLADIEGGTKAGTSGKTANGIGTTAIAVIAVGCLAVVAVVAGVRLLKKDKEPVVETPEGNLVDDYGGGITPKEDVILL